MRLTTNRFLITADADSKSVLPIKGMNGEFLYLDRKFDLYGTATQIGTIAHTPMQFDDKSIDSHILKQGDTVWFHHFVCQDKNRWLIKGEEFFQAHYNQIWAKVEDERLIPMNDWLFVEPILEEESEMFIGDLQLKQDRENVTGQGKVFATSTYAKEMGIKDGDSVFFVKDADYSIKIGEKDLWRMKVNAIVLINRKGELIPLRDKILVKYKHKEDKHLREGLWIPPSMQDKSLEGIVMCYGIDITCVKKYDHVVFYPGMFTNITWNNEDYAVMRKEFLIYVK